FGIYDFIVIGAGATGSVIANRLSKIKEWNILLLEAGSFGTEVNDIPNMALSLRNNMANKECAYPRGKGIGGSTLINGLVYSRGNKRDFDKWSELGNPGWSYNEVLPYFKISENFMKTDRNVVVDYEYHGTGGDLNVEYHIPRHPLLNLWLKANKEQGYEVVDYNGRKQIGAAVAQLNTKEGKRDHAGNAFINSIKNRSNLKIATESYVTKILIFENNKTVSGVKFSHKGQTYIAKTKKEVILSAGAIASPQILMLSGIGPAKHLDDVGIKVIENLEVGSVLRDHATFYGLQFDSNYTKTIKPLKQYIKEYFKGYGSLTYPHNDDGIGFYQTKFEKYPDYPDLEIQMIIIDEFLNTLQNRLASAKEHSWQHLDMTRSFALYIIGLHAKSTGTIRLKNSKNVDIDTLYEGIKFALSLVETQAFKQINTTLVKQVLPSCQDKPYLSKSYWYCVLRYFTSNLYHPLGTCPMGPDRNKGAVVDSRTKVYGIRNLRVADASIFPFTFSGHPNAPCVMIGEKVSDLIKLQYL
ncbi:glucose dehydrogenase [FAD, quinone]-like, partial [Asbolus verrucosus]